MMPVLVSIICVASLFHCFHLAATSRVSKLILSNGPPGKNFGDRKFLHIRSPNRRGHRESLLKFDLSTIDGKCIREASLELYSLMDASNGGIITTLAENGNLFARANQWKEGSATVSFYSFHLNRNLVLLIHQLRNSHILISLFNANSGVQCKLRWKRESLYSELLAEFMNANGSGKLLCVYLCLSALISFCACSLCSSLVLK